MVPARIERITRAAPIERVFANGATAGRLWHRYLEGRTGLAAEVLPSTSPANASWSTERLVERWTAALAVSDGPGGAKEMCMGAQFAGAVFTDLLGSCPGEVTLDASGCGIFSVNGGSVSVWGVKGR